MDISKIKTLYQGKWVSAVRLCQIFSGQCGAIRTALLYTNYTGTKVFYTSYKNIELHEQEHFSGELIDWSNLTHAAPAQDILHTRVRTSGIVEVRGKVNFF